MPTISPAGDIFQELLAGLCAVKPENDHLPDLDIEAVLRPCLYGYGQEK